MKTILFRAPRLCCATPCGSHHFGRRVTTRQHGRRRPSRSQRRGVAAVEFAVVAPVFFLLIFAIVELGRLVMVQQVLTTASREGARLAIIEGSTVSQVQTAVDDYLANLSVSGANVGITPSSLGNAEPGDPISVTVSVTFDQVSWIPSPWFLGGANLSASTLMRREGIP